MQAWVSCSGGRTTACDPHALGGDQCGEQRGPDLEHSTTTTYGAQKALKEHGRVFSTGVFIGT